MNEAGFLTRFRKKIMKKWPGAFYYKIPDTKGLGGMRPFDVVAIINKVTFCIEAKKECKPPTEWQRYNLEIAKLNGAVIYILYPENEREVLCNMEEVINERK